MGCRDPPQEMVHTVEMFIFPDLTAKDLFILKEWTVYFPFETLLEAC